MSPAHEDKTTSSTSSKAAKADSSAGTKADPTTAPPTTDFDTDGDGRSERADNTTSPLRDADNADKDVAPPPADPDADDDDVALDELGQRMDDPDRR